MKSDRHVANATIGGLEGGALRADLLSLLERLRRELDGFFDEVRLAALKRCRARTRRRSMLARATARP